MKIKLVLFSTEFIHQQFRILETTKNRKPYLVEIRTKHFHISVSNCKRRRFEKGKKKSRLER